MPRAELPADEGAGTLCEACGHANLAGADHCVECGQSLVVEEVGDADESALQQSLLRLNPRSAVCVERATPLSEVIERLRGRNVGCVVVTGHGGEVVGVFTERDVLYRVVGLIDDLEGVPVESLMTPRPTTLRPSDPISRALHLMAVHGFRHVPLEDDDGCPIAVVSLRDIIRFIEDSFLSGTSGDEPS